MTVLLGLIAAGAGGAGDFVGGYASRRSAVVIVILLSQSMAVAMLAVVSVLFGVAIGSWAFLPWAIAAGQTLLLGLIFFYTALSEGKMGIVAPIAALGVVVPVCWALTVGNERLASEQLLGFALAIAGIVLASGPELEGGTGWRPLALAVGAAVAFGLTMTFLSEGAVSEPLMTTIAMRGSLVVSLACFLAIRGSSASISGGIKQWRLLAIIAFFNGTATLSAAYAMRLGPVSVAAVLASLYPIGTVVLARIILKERTLTIQMIGVYAALMGVVLIGTTS